jgi:pSer/pThr/pTyr-binding forkhead associated (FHA) protein
MIHTAAIALYASLFLWSAPGGSSPASQAAQSRAAQPQQSVAQNQRVSDSATHLNGVVAADSALLRSNRAAPPELPAQSATRARRESSLPLIIGLVAGVVLLLSAGIVAARVVVLRRRQNQRPAEEEELPLVTMLLQKMDRPISQPESPLRAPPAAAPLRALEESNHAQPATEPPSIEGTLQLLPGRLEILTGNDRMKEVRFVRVPGPVLVTFGRYPGDKFTHVQVDSPTVSRMHASMRFAGGNWHIKNLSDTNPVIVNGQPLPTVGGERVLSDGDQVEMGEVIFRFRPR